jgi:hypothetical protein
LFCSGVLNKEDHESLLDIMDEALDAMVLGELDRETLLHSVARIVHAIDVNDRPVIAEWLHQRDSEQFRSVQTFRRDCRAGKVVN